MDQLKIGKFIAKCRKEKKLTQSKLAEILGITDRAISKWETGNGMPDSSIMLELCKILEITVNELLSGEKIDAENNDKKLNENLINQKKQIEILNKQAIRAEYIISFFLVCLILAALFITKNIEMNNTVLVMLWIGVSVSFILTVIFSLKLELDVGCYECGKCGNLHKSTFKEVFFAMHMGTTRYLKCPKCKKYSWNKKILDK